MTPTSRPPTAGSSGHPRAAPPGARAALALTLALLAGPAPRARASAGEAPARGPAPIRIELRASLDVERRRLSLGDVAIVTTRDLGTLRTLVDLPLGDVPCTPRVTRVDRTELLRWIRARTGVDARDIEWAGPLSCEIRSTARQVAGGAIAALAIEALRAELSRRAPRVEIAVAQPPRDVDVPAGQVELRPRPIAPSPTIAKRQSVWIDVRVDGAFIRTVPVALQVAAFGPAYVAPAPAPSGRVLDPSELEVREVEWSGRTSPPLAPGSTGLVRLRRALSAGDVVARAAVEPAPVVSRGGWATLHARQGVVSLESRVEVLQDGRPGQSIQVRVPNATAAIVARVAGPGIVEVGP